MPTITSSSNYPTMSSHKEETYESATSAPPAIDVHPSFNNPDADMVLISSEGTHFHVDSYILSLASGWFRALLSLPQDPAKCKSGPYKATHGTLSLSESTQTVTAFLSVIAYQPVPALDTPELVDELLRAGEKYEMPTVVSVVRLAIMSPLLEVHPIRVYGIASVRGWIEEAKLASTKTISLDLLSPGCVKELAMLNPRQLTTLMLFHRQRQDKFWAGLLNVGVFENAIDLCRVCGGDIFHVRWISIKYQWREMMEREPANIASKAFIYQKATQAVLEEECDVCKLQLYDKENIMQSLSMLVDTLPMAVEVSYA
jgi:hypothetical protein